MTVGTHDLVVSAVNGTTFWGADADVTFVELYDGASATKYTPIIKNNKMIFPDYSGDDGTGHLKVKVNTPGVHNIKLEFGSDTSYTSNLAYPASTVEINHNTANGPELSPFEEFGSSVTNIGDLDGDWVTDIAVGSTTPTSAGPGATGFLYILFLNSDRSVKKTVEIDKDTANGPKLSSQDRFGTSIANLGDLNGDGVTDIAVGANGDDGGGALRGALHILFLNTDGSIDKTVEINSTTTNGPAIGNSDNFGSSVANIGDLNGDGTTDIAVGATGDGTGGASKGTVHILFLNNNGSVNSTVEIDDLTTNGPALSNNDQFGSSVANIGDLDGDGVTDIAVGAHGDDAGGTNHGAIHILFLNTDGSVDSTVEINDLTTNGPALGTNDQLGSSVANIGDLNRDGVTDIAVGAKSDNTGGSDRGALYVMFLNTDGSVDSTIKISDATTNGPSLSNNDDFGASVTSIGDLDGDGTTDIAVGAPGNSGSRGAIHIINLGVIAPVGNGAIHDTVEINSRTTNDELFFANFDQFGFSVANIGDLDGDGVTDIAVGANGDDTGGSNSGALNILFLNSDGSVNSAIEINSTSINGLALTNSDRFGTSVTNIGDLDGDGTTDIAVGASGEGAPSNSKLGTLYILFLNSTDGSVKKIVEINSTTTNGPVINPGNFLNNFGTSVANIGDLNGDGTTDIAVGAADLGHGALYILFLNTDGSIKETAEINSTTTNGPTLSQTDYFGTSVANIGDLNRDGVIDIAVGANGDDAGGTDRGTVHILFLNTDGSVDKTVEINSITTNGPTLSNNDEFGISVANIGDLDGDGTTDIAVGAPKNNAGGTDRGTVHILFLNTDGSVDKTVEINSTTTNGPTLSNDDNFGSSVANIGDINGDGTTDIAVGAFGDDAGGDNYGAVHIIYLDKTAVATNVTSTTADGTYDLGSVININVGFSESVTVVGTPQMTLETGITDRVANYTSGNNTDTLTFQYTVQAGDTSSDLDYVGINSLTVAGSGNITTTESPYTLATLALPTPGITTLQTNPTGIFGSLGFNRDIIVHAPIPPPELDSAKIDESTGILTLNFNEDIDQDTPATDIDPSKFTITDAGNATAVSLAGALYTAIPNNATAFTLTLGSSQLNIVKSHATPDLDIAAGAVVSDASQTPIAASYDHAITILNADTTKPVFDSAKLDLGTGILTINFEEDLDQFPPSDINTTAFTITDTANASPVSLADATYTGILGNTTAFTLTLNSTQFDTVKSHATPDLDIAAGAVKDISQNPVAASENNAITLLPDTTNPVFSSATLNEGTGLLMINFDEPIDQSDPATDIIQSRFTITDAGGADAVSLQGATYTAIPNDADSFTLTLTSTQLATVKSHVTPDLDIAAGAVKDTSQNPIAASENNVITAFNKDTTRPVFNSTKIDESTGVITINFDEPIDQDPTSDVNLGLFYIAPDNTLNGITLVNAENFTTVNATAFSVQLPVDPELNTVRSYDTLHFSFITGAVKDTSQNLISQDFNRPISQINTDTTPPTFDSATLDERTRVLTINFNEDIDQNTPATDINATAFTITDAGNTSPVSLTDVTHTKINSTAFSLTLNSTQFAAVLLHTTSDLDIATGAVHDISQNPIAPSTDNTIRILEIDNTKPLFDSAALDISTGVLTINFNEPINQTKFAVTEANFKITDSTSNTENQVKFTSNTRSLYINSTAFLITLTESQLDTVRSYSTAAATHLDILTGAVSDLSTNRIAASSDNVISIVASDVTRPTLDSATLNVTSGVLTVNFDKPIDQSPLSDIKVIGFNITDATITNTNQLSLNYTIPAKINATAFTLGLSGIEVQQVIQYGTPLYLDIAAGAVKDLAGNLIALTLDDNTITVLNADTTKPLLRWAQLDTSAHLLTLNFDEDIDQQPHTDINVTAFTITDASNPLSSVSLNGSQYINGNSTSFAILLTDLQFASVDLYVTPQLGIAAGAVSDISQNPIISSSGITITVTDDNTSPIFDSASLNGITGVLTLNFNEPIDQNTPTTDIIPSRFTITNTSNTSPVPLDGATYAAIPNNATAFTLTLNSTQLTTVLLHTTSDLDITAGAVSDISNNPIISSADHTITVFTDNTKPVFADAELAEQTGLLVITFNEPIKQDTLATDINVTAFTITDAGNANAVSLAGATYYTFGPNSIALNLTETQRIAVIAHVTPDLDIEAGAVSDTSNNAIAASENNVIIILDADTTNPVFDSASIDESTGVFTINFNEEIDQSTPATDINATKFIITDIGNADAVSLQGATYTPGNATAFSLTLNSTQLDTVKSQVTSDLDIALGAVHDISQNPVAASADNTIAVLSPDVIDPELRSVSLDESTGILTINFNENIDQSSPATDIIQSKFTITDTANADAVSLAGTTYGVIPNNATAFTLALNQTQINTVRSHVAPDLDITLGAVHDISQNPVAASADNVITILNADTTKPVFDSATLDESTGILTINFNEPLDRDTPTTDIIQSKFTITDTANADAVSLAGTTYGVIPNNATAFTLAMTETQINTVRSQVTPDLDIALGAVHDISQNLIAASENNVIMILNADATNPVFDSASIDESTGVLTINFNEEIDQSTPATDINATKFIITDTGNADAVSLKGATYTPGNATAFSLTLNSTQLDTVKSHVTSDLDIVLGAVTDISQNPVAASANNTITVLSPDVTDPEFIAASLDESTGILTINFNENIDQSTPATDINTTKFTITDTNNANAVSIAGTTYAVIPSNATAFTLALNQTQINTVKSQVTPDLDIALGAVHDISQNPVAASADNVIIILNADTASPEFDSATFDENTYILTLNFDEAIDQSTPAADINMTGFALTDGKNETLVSSLANATYNSIPNNFTAFSMNLTSYNSILDNVLFSTEPVLDIAAGTIKDISQNPIAASANNTVHVISTIVLGAGDDNTIVKLTDNTTISTIIATNVTKLQIDLSALTDSDGKTVSGTATIPLGLELYTSFSNVTLPAGITISGLPDNEIISISNATNNRYVIALESSGRTFNDINPVTEFGVTNKTITFDQPVRITFANKAGGTAYYINSTTGTATQITTPCISDMFKDVELQLKPVGSETPNECVITSAENENTLVVWTTHFTSFYAVSADNTRSRGGGGGGGDKTGPSISTTFGSNEYPLVYDGIKYDSSTISSVHTAAIKTGDELKSIITVYENAGPNSVNHADMYVNHDGSRILNDRTETYVTYDRGVVSITDPHGLIAQADVTKSITGSSNNKASFEFVIVFAKETTDTDVLYRLWDDRRNSVFVHLDNALDVDEGVERSSGSSSSNSGSSNSGSSNSGSSNSGSSNSGSSNSGGTSTNNNSGTNTKSSTPKDTTLYHFSEATDEQLQIIRNWAGYSSESATDAELLHVFRIADSDDLEKQQQESLLPQWAKKVGKYLIDGQISFSEMRNMLSYVHANYHHQ